MAVDEDKPDQNQWFEGDSRRWQGRKKRPTEWEREEENEEKEDSFFCRCLPAHGDFFVLFGKKKKKKLFKWKIIENTYAKDYF